MNSEVSHYLENATRWKAEMYLLREIILDCNLQEEWKWKQPCYSYNGNNVVVLGAFKQNVRLGFFKGALLSDSENILSKPGENSHHTRQLVFTSLEEIRRQKRAIEIYLFEAIEIEKAGLKIESKAKGEIEHSEELIEKIENDPTFKIAFESLTPGRQRAYSMFISSAKNSSTKENRIKKYYKRILAGKGMNDCVCGLSKRKPTCDGSHKNLGKPLPY